MCSPQERVNSVTGCVHMHQAITTLRQTMQSNINTINLAPKIVFSNVTAARLKTQAFKIAESPFDGTQRHAASEQEVNMLRPVIPIIVIAEQDHRRIICAAIRHL